METTLDSRVPSSLRTWFVVHFWADILVAVPLFLAPVTLLEALGWQAVDPYAARIVAAALFGIGIESLLGRNGDLSAFVAMRLFSSSVLCSINGCDVTPMRLLFSCSCCIKG